MNSHFFRRFLWGLIIVFVGLNLLMGQFGWGGFTLGHIISTFWPVILILIGIDALFKRGGSGWWGIILIVLGVHFLSGTIGYRFFSIGDIIRYAIPVVVILFGLKMIFKTKRSSRPQTQDNDNWQSYPKHSPIPPPPPLHPDPTRPGAHTSSQQEDYYEPFTEDSHMDDYKSYKEKYKHYKKEYKNYKKHHDHHHDHGRTEWWNSDPGAQNRSGFIGDIYVGSDYFELRPMNISHFIGDTVIDLTKAEIPYGETKLTISSFIGDVKIFLPNDYDVGINVVTSTFIGDTKVMDRRDGGMFRNTNVYSPAYEDCDKKIRLVVSSFIGDVVATKVG
ncbi:cell wall-active antibiotics response protein LiaF [Paenibacillus sp. GCM10012307]|nr:cell wall-active antibiotics response protein LiaF [Paenibacillus roseus]